VYTCGVLHFRDSSYVDLGDLLVRRSGHRDDIENGLTQMHQLIGLDLHRMLILGRVETYSVVGRDAPGVVD
jgi:hypothetical protein